MDKNPSEGPATPRCYQPRALLFSVLSLLWMFPSLGAIWILATGERRRMQGEPLEILKFLPLEQWLAVALLAAHVTFAALAVHYRRHEAPKPVPQDAPEVPRGSDSQH